MGVRNYLIEGVSASGKTSVCRELTRRGYHAINGDKELAYQGDPQTGEPTDTADHEHHIWDVDLVRAIAAESHERATFFCRAPATSTSSSMSSTRSSCSTSTPARCTNG